MAEEVAKYDSSLPFVLFDRLDDDLIIKELEGRLPGVLTYHFNQDGQELWGLSKSGVDECSNELAKKGEVIREIECNFVDKEDEALFTVKAGRYAISKDGKEVLLDTKLGFKRQSKKTKSGKDNPFWFEQGSIKACRNSASRLIPASIKAGVIEYAKAQGKVKEVKKEQFQEPQIKVTSIQKPDSVNLTTRSSIFKAKEWPSKKPGGNPSYQITARLDGNEQSFTTWDKKIYDLVKDETDSGMLFDIEYIKKDVGGKIYHNIVSLKRADEPGEDDNAQ